MKALSISPKELAQKAADSAHKHAAIVFILFLLTVYSFLSWRIVHFSQQEPATSDVTTQLKTAGVPKVNPEAIRKIEQLKDNSVSVQTLFDQARNSPFQEQ